ncbi:TrbN protein [Methyloglobulus morosus KoM1]|uniref:TrbN protein n=1 Tax=Methyloglobulus morosus KoM1 TaxID=1116472 RepID=V5BZN7_9GAMM|nr:TrbN protein [Methyloglobulus morosus]ESS71697.1 TrbN protein [Methyloglobulus morosus KoM1]
MLKSLLSAIRKPKWGKQAMQADVPAYYQQERVECSIQAANHYRIPPLVLLAVAEQEGGKPGQKVRNINGTYDYGVMQFNTVSLAGLRPYGINVNHVLAKGCYPYYLAGWRIAGHIHNDQGDIWQRAANYHSRTPYYNSVYRSNLIRRAAKIASRLDAKQTAPGITVNSSPQKARPVKQVKSDQIQEPFSAYSAPIKVNGFDNLKAYPLQFKQRGSFGETPAIIGW